LCQLVGANGQPNVGKKVRLQLYQPPNKSLISNEASPQVCSHILSTLNSVANIDIVIGIINIIIIICAM